MPLGNTTMQGVEASSAAWGSSAATAHPWGSPVVVHVAQMQHSAIPTLESVSDRGSSSWTGGADSRGRSGGAVAKGRSG